MTAIKLHDSLIKQVRQWDNGLMTIYTTDHIRTYVCMYVCMTYSRSKKTVKSRNF